MIRKILDKLAEEGKLLPLIPPSKGPLREAWDKEQGKRIRKLIRSLEK